MPTPSKNAASRSKFGKTQFLPPSAIHVDTRYQRASTPIVKRIVDGFNEKLFEPLTIAHRQWATTNKDRYYAIDGGNRLAAAKRLGLKEVPVRIIPVSSEAEEARLFTDINRERVSVQSALQHRALVFAGDAQSVALEDTMNEVGFSLIKDRVLASSNGSKLQLLGTIGAVKFVWNLGDGSEWAKPGYPDEYRLDGARLLQETLTLIDKQWGKKKRLLAWDNNTIKAVAIVVEKFWDQLDPDDIELTMMEVAPSEIKQMADQKKATPNNFNYRAWALAKAINRETQRNLRLTNLLPE